jgi:hypothetical protein
MTRLVLHHAHRAPTPSLPARTLSRAVAGLMIAVVALVGLGSTASAGGWAVSTLDETPVPTSGKAVDVGFTIRQHGVTPVDLDEGVAIEITSADGTVLRFPAVLQGPTGHYMATVTFPDAGDYTWEVQQGWFAPQDLGSVTVTEAAGSGSTHRLPAIFRYGLPALAVVLAAAAVADLVVGRRRRRASVA